MKTLVAGLLLQYGIPTSYPMTLIVENATAALRDSTAMALAELSRSSLSLPKGEGKGQGIQVHRTEMICGTALWGGYKDRSLGNPGGKAALESTFNLFHNEAGALPGQVGRRYDQGPADLAGRTREAEHLSRTARYLTPHQRAQLKMPFLNYEQARLVITDLWNHIIRRTDHKMEAFETVGEFRLHEHDQWRPECDLLLDPAFAQNPTIRDQILWRNPPRKESPIERWSRLLDLVGGESSFRHPHPATVARLYEDQKKVTVHNSEIIFTLDKQQYVYRIANLQHAPFDNPLPNKTEALAYFDPQDMTLLHLTDGKGCYLGTIPRTRGIKRTDSAALHQDMKRKREELRQLQERVSNRLPQLAESRIADLDANTAVLQDALQNAEAIEISPSLSHPIGEGQGEGAPPLSHPMGEGQGEGSSHTEGHREAQTEPPFSRAITNAKHAAAVAQRQAAAELARIQTAPRSLKDIIAGHKSRTEANPPTAS